MKTLLELHNENPEKYHTDKEWKHKYLSMCYSKEFAKFQGKKVNVLEIGILWGTSLLLWSDYFPEGQIYGVDVNDQGGTSVNNTKDAPNIKIDFTDAYSVEYANTLPNLDIVIDDGPHTPDSQVRCIELYLPKINPGGLLIIEDIESVDAVNRFIAALPEGTEYEMIDTGTEIDYDNRVFVIRKK